MKQFLNRLFLIIEICSGAVSVLSALFIAAQAAGYWGILIGLMIFPITMFVAPIYEIVKHGNWWPILYVHGGGLLAFGMEFIRDNYCVFEPQKIISNKEKRPLRITIVSGLMIVWSMFKIYGGCMGFAFGPTQDNRIFSALIVVCAAVELILAIGVWRRSNVARWVCLAWVLGNAGLNLILELIIWRGEVSEGLLIQTVVVSLVIGWVLLSRVSRAWYLRPTLTNLEESPRLGDGGMA